MRAIWLALLLSCVSAAAPWTPGFPASPLAVGEQERQWYREIADCAGFDRSMPRSLTMWAVDSLPCPQNRARSCSGVWVPPHTIYIRRPWLGTEWLYKHEFLHDILQSGGHPPAFNDCGVA